MKTTGCPTLPSARSSPESALHALFRLLAALVLISVPCQADITTGLQLHYKFDGNANDSSGNNRNGTENGTISYSSGVAAFNGSNTYVRRQEQVTTSNPFTWICTFKLTASIGSNASMNLMSQGSNPEENPSNRKITPSLDLQNPDGNGIRVRFYTYDPIAYELLSPAGSIQVSGSPPQSPWVQVVVTSNSSGNRVLYLNGVSIDSKTGHLIGQVLPNLYVGANAAYNQHFLNGKIADVRVFNRGLSAADVVEFYSLDSDQDQLSDMAELELGTNPGVADHDGDGMPDGWEVAYQLDPFTNDASGDPDGDGLTNLQEFQAGSNPRVSAIVVDTDGDGLSDPQEATLNTNPNNPDTDGDGMRDGWDHQYRNALVLNDGSLDPDLDLLTDLQESQLGTNPDLADTDGDGINDRVELFSHQSDPTKADTDGDGLSDAWEVLYGLNVRVNDAATDMDGDGLTNLQEFQSNKNPTLWSTASDGNSDSFAVNGTRPIRYLYDHNDRLTGVLHDNNTAIAYVYDANSNLVRQVWTAYDANQNGIPDAWEIAEGVGTLAGRWVDSDGDGWSDAQEYEAGTDPKNAASRPDGSAGTLFGTSTAFGFTPTRHGLTPLDADGDGDDDLVWWRDGTPGAGGNSLTVLFNDGADTNGQPVWRTETVAVGDSGITSVTAGRRAAGEPVRLYAGLRKTGNLGKVVELTRAVNGTWSSADVLAAQSDAAIVFGVTPDFKLWTQGKFNGTNSGALFSLAFAGSVWSATLADSAVGINQAGAMALVNGQLQVIRWKTLSALRFSPTGAGTASELVLGSGNPFSTDLAVISSPDAGVSRLVASQSFPTNGPTTASIRWSKIEPGATTYEVSGFIVEENGVAPNYLTAVSGWNAADGADRSILAHTQHGLRLGSGPSGSTLSTMATLYSPTVSPLPVWPAVAVTRSQVQVPQFIWAVEAGANGTSGTLRRWTIRDLDLNITPTTANAPSVVVTSTTLAGSADVAVTLRIWDAEGNAVIPELQYYDTGTSQWKNATLRDRLGNLSPSLSAVPSGLDHVVFWDVATDLGAATPATVALRSRGSSPGGMAAGAWSPQFTLNLTRDLAPQVDLALTSATFTSGAHPLDAPLNVTVQVQNMGTAASTPSTVRLFLSRYPDGESMPVIELGTESLAGLASAATATLTPSIAFPGGTAPGLYHLLAEVNPANTPAESRRANNRWRSPQASLELAQLYGLTVNVSPAASGNVTTAPAAPSTGRYRSGTSVTLTASPAMGFEFLNWSGGASGTTSTITRAVNNAPISITANFQPIDLDLDGRTNQQEIADGTNPNNPDSDGDGLSDGMEVSLGQNPLVANTAFLNYLRSNPNLYGLYTEGQIRDLNTGKLLIRLEDGKVKLSMQVQQSNNLTTWHSIGTPFQWEAIPAQAAKFFRVEVKP